MNTKAIREAASMVARYNAHRARQTGRFTPEEVNLDPDTVLALCDAADRVETLEAELRGTRWALNEAMECAEDMDPETEKACRDWLWKPPAPEADDGAE